MDLKQQDIEALKKIVQYEKSTPPEDWSLGWSWKDVKVYTATINKLMLMDLVECTYSSNRYTLYKLTQRGRDILTEIEKRGPGVEEVSIIEFDPSELFSEIIGYDNIKELLREALMIKEPIHVLLYGPPSIAKSMFLVDIEEATGSLSLPLLGSATSHAGMWDLIVDRRPRYLLIDEIEKMTLQDMAGLLSLMEHQRIIRAKVGRSMEEQVDCRVFAAANRIGKIPPELLSRFWKCRLEEYSTSEYVHVVEAVLSNREGLSSEDAHHIAMKLAGKTHDVRDAIRVGRLSKRVGVERALQLWLQ